MQSTRRRESIRLYVGTLSSVTCELKSLEHKVTNVLPWHETKRSAGQKRSGARLGAQLNVERRRIHGGLGWTAASISTADGALSTRERRVPHMLVGAGWGAAYSPGTSYPGEYLIRWEAGAWMDDGDDGRSGWLPLQPSNPLR